jgi:hypothetical protein
VIAKSAGSFALNMLGKGQQRIVFGFFQPVEVNGDTISAGDWIAIAQQCTRCS